MPVLGPEDRVIFGADGLRYILDWQVEHDVSDTLLRERLLGALSVLSDGQTLESGELRGLSNHRPLSPMQRIDRLELQAGYPPHRHTWTHGLERDRATVFPALIRRMSELQGSEQRDSELERATIEMGSMLLMGSDEHGNSMLQYIQVQADEIYELGQKGVPIQNRNITSFPLNCGNFALGDELGFDGPNAEQWYVTSVRQFAAPLNTITGFPPFWVDGGRLTGVQYKQSPIAAASLPA